MSEQLTKPGQIKPEDVVILYYGGNKQIHLVDDVLNPGTKDEEILLDTPNNKYFITSMAIEGSSWAKEVRFINMK